MKTPIKHVEREGGYFIDANNIEVSPTEIIHRCDLYDDLVEALSAYAYGCPDNGYGHALLLRCIEEI